MSLSNDLETAKADHERGEYPPVPGSVDEVTDLLRRSAEKTGRYYYLTSYASRRKARTASLSTAVNLVRTAGFRVTSGTLYTAAERKSEFTTY